MSFYVAHRLFSLHDRALGALVAESLAVEVGANRVFLPFCDTDEDSVVSSCKGRLLFDLDTHRLRLADGMIAVLHGPSLDDGVCMEIGFAAAAGVPVIALTTDFQTYGRTAEGPILHFPDPLVESVVHDVVRVADMADPPTSGPAVPDSRFRVFGERNLQALSRAATTAARRLLQVARPTSQATNTTTDGPSAFIEPTPYRRSGSWRPIADALASRGYRIRHAERLTEPDEEADAVRRSLHDWRRSAESDVLVVDVSGPETPPGAAVLIGASVQRQRPVYAASLRGGVTFAPGREPNRRNLMIEYGVTGWFGSSSELIELIEQ